MFGHRPLRFEPLEDRRLLSVAVGDFVWQDLNGNGIQDADELGVAGVAVEIFSSTDAVVGNADDVSRGQAVTDASGHYAFTSLPDGLSYYLVFHAPVGYTFTAQAIGNDPTVDSDPNSSGVTGLFTIPSGQNDTSRDAGLVGAVPGFGWALSAGGTGQDSGQGIARDSAGNIYVTGSFRGPADVDPGPGIYNLAGIGGYDVFVAKYTSGGALVWARAVGGTGADQGNSIAVGADGSVYTTGYFSGTADFDPGSGTCTLASAGNTDIFISKLDASGNFVWARSLGGTSYDEGYGIAVAGDGSVYTTGYFSDTVDFDPGSGTYNLTSNGGHNIFVSILDAAGNFVWARAVGGAGGGEGYGIAVAADGSVYTTGFFSGTVDFDPGSGTFNLTSAGGSYDIFVSKLDASGNFVWARAMGGTDSDEGYAIAVAADGSVCTTGYFSGTADFDPGSGTLNLASNGSYDIFVSKLDASGNFVWARAMGGLNADEGRGIAVAADGSVYATGDFVDTMDFDPGSGTFNVIGDGRNIFVSKLDASGNFVWARVMGVSGFDFGYGIALAPDGSVYTTGSFNGPEDFDPTGATFNLTTVSSSTDIFVSKLLAPHVPTGLSISCSRVLEGQSAGTMIGLLQATDPDPGESFTYSLVSGDGSDDNGSFAVVGTTLCTAAVLNYQNKTSESVRLRVTDTAGLTYEQSLTIQVVPAANAASVGDRVWLDTNGNGIQDAGEPGLASTRVEIYSAADGLFRGMAATDANGNYTIGQLLDGVTYYLVFRPPVGYTMTAQYAGNNPSVDSDADATANTGQFTLSPGQNDTRRDAGLIGAAPSFGWALQAGGSGSAFGQAIARDSAGNLYVTGYFSGTADFDPGPGTYGLTSGGDDGFVAKYNSVGSLIWARSLGGPGYGITVAPDGSVYTTGTYAGPADFDPGSGKYILDGIVGVFVLKLDAAGNFVWVRTMDGNSIACGCGIAVAADGSVCTTGYFRNWLSYGTGGLSCVGRMNIFVAKLDASGNFVWARSMGGTSGGAGSGITVAVDGSVYTTGYFDGTVDFDPGGGTFNLTATGSSDDIFISKLDAAGNFVWARAMGGTSNASGGGIALGPDGSVFTTGYFNGTTDFDPGSGTFNLTSTNNLNVFVSKLDASGNFAWARAMGGNSGAVGNGIAVAADGSVYTTGNFSGTADFDPGTGSFNLNTAGGRDIFVSKLNDNQPPEDLLLTATSIADNRPVGTVVGTLSSADADLPNDSFIYALVPGTGSDDNAAFTIVGNQLVTATPLNVHAKSSYTVRIRTTDAGTIWFEKQFSIAVTDATPPTIAALSPPDNATSIATNTNLVIDFNENVKAGASGNVVIRKTGDNSVLETTPVAGTQVTIAGTQVTIDPAMTFDHSTQYYIQIDAGALEDLSGNAFAGIDDATTWNFTTLPTDTAATVSSSGAPSVYGQSVTFTAAVTAGGSPVTSGTVDFVEGATVLAGGVSLDGSGHASFSTSALTVTASPHVIAAVYNGTTQYATSSGSASQTVTPAPLTFFFSAGKRYDGTTAIVSGQYFYQLLGLIGNDQVSATWATANYTDKRAGGAVVIPVVFTGLTLTGPAAGNYVIATISTRATIDPRTLTLTPTVQSKVYDGTTACTMTMADNRVAGDVLTVNYSAAFVSPNVAGTPFPDDWGKVNITGLSLSDADAGNYQLPDTSMTTHGTILPRMVQVTATGASMTYDGSNYASVSFSFSNLVPGQWLTTYPGIQCYDTHFADKNVGTNKPITIKNATYLCPSCDYEPVSIPTSTTGSITAKSLTVTAAGANKTYDGTTAATVTLSDNRVTGDVLTKAYASATFADQNAGTGKTVTVSGISIGGTDAGNYSLSNATANTTAAIAQATPTVTVTDAGGVYNGSAFPAVAKVAGVDAVPAASLEGVTPTLTYYVGPTATGTGTATAPSALGTYTVVASFAGSTDYAAAQSSPVTFSIFSIAAASTKTAVLALPSPSVFGQSVTFTAAVTAGGIAVTDGTVDFFEGATLLAGGVSLDGDGHASFSTADLSVTASPHVITAFYDGTAEHATSFGATSLTVTPAPLIACIQAHGRYYDGTTAATIDRYWLIGLIGGDHVGLTWDTVNFADKNVGQNKLLVFTGFGLTGATAGNYSVSNFIFGGPQDDILPRAITLTPTVQSKVFDGTTAATVTFSDDRVAGDVLTVNYANAKFDSPDVSTPGWNHVTISGIALSGADAGNYLLPTTSTSVVGDGAITPVPLTVHAGGNSKTYDGQNWATLTLFYDGFVAGDHTSGLTVQYGAQFADKNVGSNKPVTITHITSMCPSGDYWPISLPTSATGASILAKSLTVSAAGVNKVYDGTTAATVTLSDNRVAGDVLTRAYTSAAFADKNAGPGKTVTVSGIGISGADAGNYALSNTTAGTTAAIAQATLTVTAAGVDKVYDGTTAATVTLTDNRMPGDNVTETCTAAFDDPSAGLGKTVTVSGIAIGGSDAGNYTLGNTTAGTTAAITQATPTVTVTDAGGVYDGSAFPAVAKVAGVDGVPAESLEGVTPTLTYYVGPTATGTGTATAPSALGIYTVVASFAGSADYAAAQSGPVTFSIAVTSSSTSVAASSSPSVYGQSVTFAATVTSGGAAVTVGTVDFLDGTTVLISGVPLDNTGQASFSISTLSVTASPHVVTAVYDGTTEYLTSSGSTSQAVTPAPLVAYIQPHARYYDGTTVTTIDRYWFSGLIGADPVGLTWDTVRFTDKNVGMQKPLIFTGLGLTGAAAGNYSLASTIFGNGSDLDILPRPLHVTAAGADKIYDGTPAATVTLSDDRLPGDNVGETYASAAFDDKIAGPGKTVTVSGIGISGTDAGNYSLSNTTATATAAITPATPAVTVTDAGGVYNGSAFPAVAKVAGVDAVPADSLEGVTPTLTYYVGTTATGTGMATAPSALGTYTVVASFAGSADYAAGRSSPVTFAITAAAAILGSEIVGDGQPGFWSSSSTNWTAGGQGLDGGSLVSNTDNGSRESMAAWWFSMPAGVYEIDVTWPAAGNLTTKLGLDLYDGVGNWIGQVPVNQQIAPNDFADQGVGWKRLGSFNLANNIFHVSTWNIATDGAIAIDAIRLRAVPTIDDTDAPIVGIGGAVADSGRFATTGFWTTGTQGAFGGSHIGGSTPGSGTSVATWTMPVTPGSYEVDVTWAAASTLSANAIYNVYDGGTLLGSVGVNQQMAPSGPTDNGATWNSLGNFTVTGTQLRVTVANAAGEQVMADAVRILPAYQPTPLVNDGGPGSWYNTHWIGIPQGLFGNAMVSGGTPGDRQSQAAWWFPCRPGSYDVQVTWQPGSTYSQNAQFDVYNALTYISSGTVNERNAPVGVTDQGVTWQSLGIFTITSNVLHVSTWNSPTDGVICVDGVRIVPV